MTGTASQLNNVRTACKLGEHYRERQTWETGLYRETRLNLEKNTFLVQKVPAGNANLKRGSMESTELVPKKKTTEGRAR